MRVICVLALLAAAFETACGTADTREPVLGEAFVGPVSLQIRAQLAARSPVAATVRHGERVEIIGRRRRFYKVRTRDGQEGWVDGRQLLSPGDMEELRLLAGRAAKAPSQGRATVFEPLNVHTAANRQAPSFFQIKPGAQVDVIAQEKAPRVPFEAPEFIRPAPKPPPKGGKNRPPVPPLAPASAPPLPDNWLELSRTEGLEPAAPAQAPAQTAVPAAGQPLADEWALVRGQDGKAGWVLARMLWMSIPDEVAQYAERARIVAYFQLGRTRAREGQKPAWLWAAQSQRQVPFDFDSLRIFTWNPKRQRYETSFIERNLKGYLPVAVRGGPDGATGFSVVVEEKSGELTLREYAFPSGAFRARIAGRRETARAPSWQRAAAGRVPAAGPPEPEPQEGWAARASRWIRSLPARFRR